MPPNHIMRSHQVSNPNLHHGYGHSLPPNFEPPQQKKKKHAKAKPQRESHPQPKPPPSSGFYPAPHESGTYYLGEPVHGESYHALLKHDHGRSLHQPTNKMPGDPATLIPANKRKCNLSGLFACLSVISYLAAIILGGEFYGLA
jgi:hypothetical protein